MEGLPKLKYCKCKSGNGSFSKIATHEVKLRSRKDDPESIPIKGELSYRCQLHSLKGTTGKRVFESIPFDQTLELQEVNDYLKSLIGKKIESRVHTAKELEVKYLKDNGGVMCLQPITKKWKFVYHDQISNVL